MPPPEQKSPNVDREPLRIGAVRKRWGELEVGSTLLLGKGRQHYSLS